MTISIGTQHEHLSPRRPDDDDRRQWIASIDPERPAEITAPIPIAQCTACLDNNRHTWSETNTEHIAQVTLRRLMCACTQCGRCDAQLVLIDLNRRSWSRLIGVWARPRRAGQLSPAG